MNNQNKHEVINTPRLVLDDTTRLYLALATKTQGKLTFVYTLVCRRAGAARWNMAPVTEIASFYNAADAEMYAQTVRQVMNIQQQDAAPKKIKSLLFDQIQHFNQKTR